MKTILSCALLCLLLNIVKAQSDISTLPAEFQKKLNEANMSFSKPDGVTETPTIKSDKVNYDYAVKVNGKNVEIRYALRPIPKEVFDVYENREKKDGDSVLNPNKIHRILTPMMYSVISGGKLASKAVTIQYFSPESIKKSAGADVGSMSRGPLGSDWAQVYNFGFYVMLHKDNLADAYIFYLFETEEQMLDIMMEITSNDALFNALKFK